MNEMELKPRNKYSIETLFAHLKEKILLGLIRFQTLITEGELNGLKRIKEYLRVSLRLEAPPYVHPLQKPIHYFPGLTAKPWYDAAQFEWTAILENAYEIIKAEFLRIPETRFQLQEEELADAGQWKVYYFYYLGRRHEENCKQCPQITQIIDTIPAVTNTGLVYFSVLGKNRHLRPHCGPLNTRLRCHLGVFVPEDCQIRVGNQTRSWEEGRCLVLMIRSNTKSGILPNDQG